MWDFARIFRNPTNEESVFCASIKLSPTAVLPACWALDCGNKPGCYIWRIIFSTDTAIPWTLYRSSGSLSLTALTAANLGRGSLSPQTQWRGQVAAAPANAHDIDSGWSPASTRTEILSGGWLQPVGNTSVVLATGAVAANCSCTFWFA